MKIEVELDGHGAVTHEAEKMAWRFENGCVDIYAEEKQVATYRLDQVLWVRDMEAFKEQSITK